MINRDFRLGLIAGSLLDRIIIEAVATKDELSEIEKELFKALAVTMYEYGNRGAEEDEVWDILIGDKDLDELKKDAIRALDNYFYKIFDKQEMTSRNIVTLEYDLYLLWMEYKDDIINSYIGNQEAIYDLLIAMNDIRIY